MRAVQVRQDVKGIELQSSKNGMVDVAFNETTR